MRNAGFVRTILIVIGAGGGLLALFFPGLVRSTLDGAEQESQPRRIVIVARDMAFFLVPERDGEGQEPGAAAVANPTLFLRPGETVMLELRNEDRGVAHDLVIEALGVRTPAVAFGQSKTLTFTVPTLKGTYTYLCSFHVRMMRGEAVVQ